MIELLLWNAISLNHRSHKDAFKLRFAKAQLAANQASLTTLALTPTLQDKTWEESGKRDCDSWRTNSVGFCNGN